MDRVNYDTLVYVARSPRPRSRRSISAASRFGPSPYVVSQLTGAYQSVPDFLDTKHRSKPRPTPTPTLRASTLLPVSSTADTERMKHDAGLGVVPPGLPARPRAGADAPRSARLPDKSLARHLDRRRAKAKGLPDSYAAKAAQRSTTPEIGPALDRQIAQTKAMRAMATHDAGVWKLKDGEAYLRGVRCIPPRRRT